MNKCKYCGHFDGNHNPSCILVNQPRKEVVPVPQEQSGNLTSPEISTERVGAQTPRTDAARKRAILQYQVLYPTAKARPVNDLDMADLEHELNEAREQIETLKVHVRDANKGARINALVNLVNQECTKRNIALQEQLSALTKQPEGLKSAKTWYRELVEPLKFPKFQAEECYLALRDVEAIQQNAITATRAEMEKTNDNLFKIKQAAIVENVALKKEMAELLKDRERLDWFDNVWQGLTIDYQPRQYQKFLLIHIITKEILGLGATLRQAIDAAIARQG